MIKTMACAVGLVAALTACGGSEPGGDSHYRVGGAATCVVPFRYDGMVYAGVGYASQAPTIQLGMADEADCNDVGEGANVSFPAEPDQVPAWAFDGVDPAQVISVPGPSGRYVVLVARSVPERRTEILAHKLT